MGYRLVITKWANEISLLINLFLYFLTCDFIMRMKSFWDLVYFDKITEIYNACFIFGNEKSEIKRLYQEAEKQIVVNIRARKLLLLLISTSQLTSLMIIIYNFENKPVPFYNIWIYIVTTLGFSIDMYMIYIIYKSS